VTEYVTRPRALISRILSGERRYLSAGDIHGLLDREQAKVALSTVYRTLEHLLAKGQVSARVDAAGEATYVSCAGDHHHHAICRVCGKVEDVDCSALEAIGEALKAHHNFQLEDHSVEFFGRCNACG
jgi:Fur family ferric uptake transcriptional regulator